MALVVVSFSRSSCRSDRIHGSSKVVVVEIVLVVVVVVVVVAVVTI
jgi:hypothetical protein